MFDILENNLLRRPGGLDCVDDVVVESPFAPPGQPKRYEGREEFLSSTRESRETLPVRFEEVRRRAMHETTDPEVYVFEYDLVGTVLPSGKRASAAFVVVARIRDGLIVHWREYGDTLAMAEALGQLPQATGKY